MTGIKKVSIIVDLDNGESRRLGFMMEGAPDGASTRERLDYMDRAWAALCQSIKWVLDHPDQPEYTIPDRQPERFHYL